MGTLEYCANCLPKANAPIARVHMMVATGHGPDLKKHESHRFPSRYSVGEQPIPRLNASENTNGLA